MISASPMVEELSRLFSIIKQYDIWLFLAWNDIKSRYRRTRIGPFWLVIANGLTILGMGLIWSIIFKMSLHDYFPKLTAAMISWIFISYTIIESPITFTQQASIIQNLPYSLYLHPLRTVCRTFITFLHNLFIYLVVMLIFGVPVTVYTLLFIPMLALIVINAFLVSFTLGVAGARFRDLSQVIPTFMNLVVFVTPVMWDKAMLGQYYLLAYLNPLTHFLNVLKEPLLGQMPDPVSIIAVCVMTLINMLITIWVATRFRHRIPFWL